MRGNSCINIETLIHLLNALPHELGVEFCEIRYLELDDKDLYGVKEND